MFHLGPSLGTRERPWSLLGAIRLAWGALGRHLEPEVGIWSLSEVPGGTWRALEGSGLSDVLNVLTTSDLPRPSGAYDDPCPPPWSVNLDNLPCEHL